MNDPIDPAIVEMAKHALRDAELASEYRMGLFIEDQTLADDAIAVVVSAVADDLRAEGDWRSTECTCIWHPAGGPMLPPEVEYQPNCPEHSGHLWDPKRQAWALRSDLRAEGAAEALREAADALDREEAEEAAKVRMGNVRCLVCELEWNQRGHFGCHGDCHEFDGADLSRAGEVRIEETYAGQFLRARADALEAGQS